MSPILTSRVKNHINNAIKEHIFLKDCLGDEQKLMSRGLVAITLAGLSGLGYENLANYITDGTKDNGIDGVYYDDKKNKLYIIQAKWSTKGTGTIDTGDLRKFIAGIYLLLNEEWKKFNLRFKSISSEISSGLQNDPEVVIITAFNSDNDLSPDCKEIIAQFLNENNSDSQEVVTFSKFDLRKIVRTIKAAQTGASTDVELSLLQWGEQIEPYYSIYGKISCADIAEWYSTHEDLLFSENIRGTLSDSEINLQIENSLLRNPEEFWYLNNGLTAIANDIKRARVGLGAKKESSLWKVSNLKIVNGAQTTSSIYAASIKKPTIVKRGYVQIKIISLENSSLNLSSNITTATNTQNKVEAKDFLALDELQNGLAESFKRNNVQYCFRRGDPVTDEKTGLDVQELALTLAVSSSNMVDVVTAKSNVGELTDRNAYYPKIFSNNIDVKNAWAVVQKHRKATKILSSFASKQAGRDLQLAVYGNRFIEHIAITSTKSSPSIALIQDIHNRLMIAIAQNYPDAYLGALFKNAKKCQLLKDALLSGNSVKGNKKRLSS
ncbi:MULTISPECIES: AIPR family protein [unclassified Duganella]|uniref:AIPR family protein n=1 Tax=unclassified Duganella TaxID=2636909 RepID=UPI000887BA46|nr:MULTISPECIES: AIPR family protein [unclassified Duganella]SDF95076.1 Restriction endonuclease [Duganella sp. OV458]SDJ09624.1 Restriction endonuclease [Duganella sp. OV510]